MIMDFTELKLKLVKLETQQNAAISNLRSMCDLNQKLGELQKAANIEEAATIFEEYAKNLRQTATNRTSILLKDEKIWK